METVLQRLTKTPEEFKALQQERLILEVTEHICQLLEEQHVSRMESPRAHTSPWARCLVLLLRVTAVSMGLALVPAFMPLSWMAAVHEGLKIGPFPQGPIVEYLARSLSGFYAIHGGLMWLVSTDLRRYSPILTYLIWVMIAGGAALFVLDVVGGLPAFWIWGEGPVVVGTGALLLIFKHKSRLEA